MGLRKSFIKTIVYANKTRCFISLFLVYNNYKTAGPYISKIFFYNWWVTCHSRVVTISWLAETNLPGYIKQHSDFLLLIALKLRGAGNPALHKYFFPNSKSYLCMWHGQWKFLFMGHSHGKYYSLLDYFFSTAVSLQAKNINYPGHTYSFSNNFS